MDLIDWDWVVLEVYERLLLLVRDFGKGVDSRGRFGTILGGFPGVLLLLPPPLLPMEKEEVGVVAIVESEDGWCLISNDTLRRFSLLTSSLPLLLLLWMCGTMEVVPTPPLFQ